MTLDEILAGLRQAVLDCDDDRAAALAKVALDCAVPALEAIDGGLVQGIQEAGRRWDEGEFFLPELVGAAGAMKAAMTVLQPALAGGASRELGRVVIGTVQGDIHDIGKSLVGTLLAANGFAVSDEGADVPVERFVARAREVDADLVCASALLTTTMVQQRALVEALRAAGLRARVMVGGAPVTPSWATQIGADGFADNAVAAVAVARGLVRP
ncbi:MAG TPA: cobalamin-dependent protein [Thermoanaerobaculaceae bacterium]|nr:cobalamin-dependent protein [Thermoanaerobaculaceae bacterium]HPS78993.1 cobalamin-dependent protein [Thermoanaerobaculaceae bacterium]